MPDHPSISVVVPTYNRAALIGPTLEAILGQTCPPDEVIVIDDGSTDATGECVARYAPAVRCRRIDNMGDLAARNIGLREARGERVAFCDSDDLWRPGYLAAAAAAWRLEPGLKLLFSNFVVIIDGVWRARSKFDDAPSGFWDGVRPLAGDAAVFDAPLIDRILRFQPFFPSCLVIDRDFFLGLGGWDQSVGRMVGSDLATTLRLAEHVPFGILRQAHVGIRKHAGNFSADVLAMNLGDAAVLDHVLARRPWLAAFEQPIRESAARRRMQALETAFARRELGRVREIAAMLTLSGLKLSACPRPVRIKAAIAALPAPAGAWVCGALQAVRRPARSGLV